MEEEKVKGKKEGRFVTVRNFQKELFLVISLSSRRLKRSPFVHSFLLEFIGESCCLCLHLWDKR